MQLFNSILLKLHRAVIDHVSDVFVEPCSALDKLVEAAQSGNEALVNSAANQFNNHALQMDKVQLHNQSISQ